MQRIFGFEPGDCLLSDESSLGDFGDFGRLDPRVHDRIQAAYGVDTSSLGNATIVELLDLIAARR